MSDDKKTQKIVLTDDAALKAAHDMAEEVEVGPRHPKGWEKFLVPGIAAAWSIFQLAIAKFWLLNSTYSRAIHLAFALSLVFLSFPAIKKSERAQAFFKKFKIFSFLGERQKIPFVDLLLAIAGACAALYLVWDYEGISSRMGLPLDRDIIAGIVLLVLLLEGARRALGLALPIIASVFIAYSFFSEYMPSIIAFKNASLSKMINKLTMSTEGVFGVPLDVSTSTVFLFVLFGAMLEKAGGGQFFIKLAFSLLGKYRGGPGKAAVLASGLTGMVSGSSIANTVTTGTFTIPLMKKAGYPGVKAGAIEVAASTNGQLMPPIMGAAAFIIAEYCNMSYFQVVRAAFIPAIVSYIALIYITHIEALKLDLKPMDKKDIPKFWETLKSGLHFLIPLFFLLYQLIIARRSAPLSAFYAICTLAVVMIVEPLIRSFINKHDLIGSFKTSLVTIWESLVAGGRAMMTIGVAVAAAGIIVGVVTLGLGQVVTELIAILSAGNLFLLLLITAVASLILGMGLPTTANYIVMATLTAPVIVELGREYGLVVPLIAAHLFVFYFGILADDTPPVGLSAYAAAAISGEDPIATGIQGFKYDIRTAILPFMFIFNTDLLLLDVQSPVKIVLIFAAALVAMFAFASLTQNFFLARNRIHESLLLALCAFMLLRPDFFAQSVALSPTHWKFIGFSVYFVVMALQWKRRTTGPTPAPL